jgi:hypothetical protein
MCHVQESAGSIALDTHIFGFCQARQRTQRAGPSDLRLVVLVGSEIRYTTHGIALDLNVWRHHLSYERRQTSEADYRDFVFG